MDMDELLEVMTVDEIATLIADEVKQANAAIHGGAGIGRYLAVTERLRTIGRAAKELRCRAADGALVR